MNPCGTERDDRANAVEPDGGQGPDSGVEEPSIDMRGALHEVSNALTVVLGWLEVAASSDGQEAREAIRVARTHAQLGHRLAREAIGAKVRARDIGQDLAGELASAVLVAVKPEALRRGVTLRMEGERDSSALIHSSTAAVQILTNLLLNGIEFSPAGSSVELRVTSDESSVRFRVTDSGPGIARERVEGLFSSPHSTRSGGAGVGLRHSEALARLNGAELSLVSHEPSASFELRWPLGNPAEQESGSWELTTSLKDARILVLEDDPAVCSLIELGLGSRGAEVIPAQSVNEFEQVLAGRPIVDAALIDLSPIQGSVTASLAKLRDVCPAVRLVLITGCPDGVPAEVAGQFVGWVRKPFEIRELAQALETALATPARTP